MSRLHVPKEINEKTRYIKAFCKKLTELEHVIDDDRILEVADYYYQSAKESAEDAALLYHSRPKSMPWPV